MSSNIKCIFTDVDGTLANSYNKLSIRNENALLAAKKAGIIVVPATGRSNIGFLKLLSKNIKEIAKYEGFPGIFFNGTVLIGPKSPYDILKLWTIPDECMYELCNFLDSIKEEWYQDDEGYEEAISHGEINRGIAYSVYLSNDFVHKVRGSYLRAVEGLSHEFSRKVDSVIEIIKNNPNTSLKFVIGESRVTMQKVKNLLEKFLENKPARVLFSHPDILEILPEGCSKGTAAKYLLNVLKIDPSECMAIGDAENDVEILKYVGISVAVSNACSEVKSAAKYIVASNNDDGFAEAVEKFCNLSI
ncbi:haloacid dehalogenase-like hydrolase family protein [Cryptosporidium serpentis]